MSVPTAAKVWLLILLAVHTVRAPICSPTCLNGGTCMDVMGNYMCNCTANWTGPICEDAVTMDSCSQNPCVNGGSCMPMSTTYNCMCPAGFTGMNCQNDACNPDPCKNGGMCMRDTSGNRYQCICTSLYVGTNCELNNPCQPNPCQSGGNCVQEQMGTNSCQCLSGFSGIMCEINDPCVPNPCKSGGTCSQDPLGASSCQCPSGFTGNMCQNNNPAGTSNTTAIVIAVVAVVVALLVVLVIVVICLVKRSRRRISRRKPSKAENERGHELGSNHYEAEKPRASGSAGGSREFPRDKLHLFGQVGSGSFAIVYKAAAEGIVQRGTTTTVAVKMLKESATPNDKSDFKKELHLYSMLDPHPNVLSMFGCCTDKDPMYIILEYVPHGNLQSYLRHIRTGTEPAYMNKAEFQKDNLSPSEILNFACQVVRGMEYLTSKQCIHRDLATRNILLGVGLVCKVSDFGLARDVAEEHQYEMQSQGRVPVRWMAPESLINNMYTSKSDVWAFGVLLWELVTLGSHPYPGMSSQKVISELKEGYRLPKPDHCSADIYKIMTDCWQESPVDRPDFERLHIRLDDLLADATGYLEMSNLNQDDYTYLAPGQPSSTESS